MTVQSSPAGPGLGLVVLNADLSGINAYMFAALRRLGWDVRAWDVPIPAPLMWKAAVRSFRFNKAHWKRNYQTRLLQLARTDDGLVRRTHRCSTALGRLAKPGDIMLSFGTLFNPKHLRWDRPYVVFKDYTTVLAARSRLSSLPVHGKDLDRWMQQEGDVCRNAALVFTASDNTRRSIIHDYGVPSERVVTVGEGLCFDDVPEAAVTNEPCRNSLFVGKDFERKGGRTVLAAFQMLLTKLPDTQLTVLGPEAPRTLPRNVSWPGLMADRERVRGYFRSADIFVMPSLTEPFGLVFLEAMAHGVPCIGSRRDAMPEIIDDGKTGFLVEPDDAGALCEKLSFLLQNSRVAREMGRRGYEKVVSRFLWPHVAQRMDEHLRRLVARGN